MKRFTSRAIWIAIFLGALFLYDGVSDTIDSQKTPANFNELKEADIYTGMIVEGDLACNYGAFEEEYRTTYGIKTGDSNYTYLIPIGEKFMGLKNQTTEQQNALDSQANSTIDLLLGDSSVQPSVFHFKGRVVALTSEDQGYMKDYLISMGYTEATVNQYMFNYCIECVDFSGGMGEIAIGLLLLVVGLVVLIAPWVEEQRKQKRMKEAHAALERTSSNYTERKDPFYHETVEQDSYNEDAPLKMNTYSESMESTGMNSANMEENHLEQESKTGLSLKLKDE